MLSRKSERAVAVGYGRLRYGPRTRQTRQVGKKEAETVVVVVVVVCFVVVARRCTRCDVYDVSCVGEQVCVQVEERNWRGLLVSCFVSRVSSKMGNAGNCGFADCRLRTVSRTAWAGQNSRRDPMLVPYEAAW